MGRRVVAAVVWAFVSLAVAEDTLILKDGKVLRGKILAVTKEDVQIQTAGETMRVPTWAIDKIERETSGEATRTDPGAKKPVASRTAPPRPSVPDAPAYAATPAFLAWIDLCAAQLSSEDPGVRAGVTAALRSAGSAARPALERLAAGEDKRVAQDAQRLLAQVERIESRRDAQARATRTRTDDAIEALGLAGEPAAKFREILDAFQLEQREVAAALRSGKLDVAEAAARMQEQRKKRDEALAAHLSEEQLRAYRETWAADDPGGK